MLARKFQAVVEGRDDPRPAVQAISDLAWSEGGFLLENCHVVMHTVGRTYARDADVNLATLMDYLPQSNDPGCSAGFAHGLVTGVAPDIDPSQPAEAATACADADTRFQRYSCVHGFGHAFMRLYGDQLEPALAAVRRARTGRGPRLRAGRVPRLLVRRDGADDATLRERAAHRPAAALRRPSQRSSCGPAGTARSSRPAPTASSSRRREDLDDLCEDLDGIQRGGCITGAAVIGPSIRPRSFGSAPPSKRPRTPRTACAGRRCKTCSTGPRANTCA